MSYNNYKQTRNNMNAYTFEEKLKKENNNKVNLISSCEDGYYVTTFNGRMHISEMRRKNELKIYPTLDDAKSSEQLKKYASFPTYLVTMHGTDYANAEVKKVSKRQTWNNVTVEARTSCPTISNVKWMFIRSNNVSNALLKKLAKKGISAAIRGNCIFFYYYEKKTVAVVEEILKNYKTKKFEILHNIEDRQYGMSVEVYADNYKMIPNRYFLLKDKPFFSYVPITKKQQDSIIKVNY